GGDAAAAPRAGRGRLSLPSVTQMLPSRSTKMPCANAIMPAPKLFTSLPDASNFRTGSSGDILPVAGSAQLLAPHRSATQIDFPSLSMSTALVDPQVRPAGSLK